MSQILNDFTPNAYDADLTMDGTAQSLALKNDTTVVDIYNHGATTEDIRVAFGASAAAAETNLTIATGAATTGYIIPPEGDNIEHCRMRLGVPSGSTHVAVANAVATDVQVVSIAQGK
jgi:hypothetical protein